MKKVLLILICFCLTGCFDYKELDDLAYISAYGLDYQNGAYLLTLEVLDNKKESDSIKEKAYTISGYGKTILEAYSDATSKLAKTSFLSHATLLIVSTNFAKQSFLETEDFILRDAKVYDEITILITNNDPNDILSYHTDENPIASNYLKSLIQDNEYFKSYAINTSYSEAIDEMHSQNIDAKISVVTLKDNKLIIDGMATFNNYELKDILSIEDANLYNGLKEKETIYLNEDDLCVYLNLTKVNYVFKDKEIIINIEGNIDLKDNQNNLDLKDNEAYNNVSKIIEDKINNKITNFINKLQTNQCDILGIRKKYYNSYRISNNNEWVNDQITIKTNLKVIRKGLIYNIND